MPHLLHFAAIRYIVTTCHYLGIPRVAIATERFALSEAVKEVRDAHKMYEKLVLDKSHYHKFLLANEPYFVKPFQVNHFGLDQLHKYPLYELINLTHLANDVDVELVQTGQVDQAALQMTIGGKSKPLQLRLEQEPSTETNSANAARIISAALQMVDVGAAREYISENTPATWNKCIYAEHNRQLLL